MEACPSKMDAALLRLPEHRQLPERMYNTVAWGLIFLWASLAGLVRKDHYTTLVWLSKRMAFGIAAWRCALHTRYAMVSEKGRESGLRERALEILQFPF
jgi:hypothetical protein